MRRKRGLLLAGTLAALVCALAAVVLAATTARSDLPAGAETPIAVVLIPKLGGSELVVVDLDRATVARRVVLRSLVTGIDADSSHGTVIGAQTGGLGAEADDAVSVTDPRTGEVRYITLPRTDPSQVAYIGGRALVLHSWVESAGVAVSAVDLEVARASDAGSAPDGSGLWGAAGGVLWTAASIGGPQRFALTRLDPATLAVTRVGGVDMSPSVVVGTREGVAVLGAMAGDTAGTGRVALLDAVDWAVVASATVSGLPHGAQTAAVAGRTLVIGDWMGEAPESNALVVLDGRTLEPIARLRVGVAPCALAGYGDRLLVVDRSEGVLRCVDPVSGVVDWSVDLGANGLLCSAVLVFDGPSD